MFGSGARSQQRRLSARGARVAREELERTDRERRHHVRGVGTLAAELVRRGREARRLVGSDDRHGRVQLALLRELPFEARGVDGNARTG